MIMKMMMMDKSCSVPVTAPTKINATVLSPVIGCRLSEVRRLLRTSVSLCYGLHGKLCIRNVPKMEIIKSVKCGEKLLYTWNTYIVYSFVAF